MTIKPYLERLLDTYGPHLSIEREPHDLWIMVNRQHLVSLPTMICELDLLVKSGMLEQRFRVTAPDHEPQDYQNFTDIPVQDISPDQLKIIYRKPL